MLLGCPHPNAQFTMDVAITGVPRGIYYSPQYFVLEFLYPLDAIVEVGGACGTNGGEEERV
jgi:hypothetical protein